ncbi:unnamed protein product [Cuscuta campestris]|uniref:Uncharacterized protein n=1 Tax=Cuscuta campestris TaxID=132261 RepID=A0A484LMJ0_9ASTE|nr:unnamed protein product [Cuscuta campestris]
MAKKPNFSLHHHSAVLTATCFAFSGEGGDSSYSPSGFPASCLSRFPTFVFLFVSVCASKCDYHLRLLIIDDSRRGKQLGACISRY